MKRTEDLPAVCIDMKRTRIRIYVAALIQIGMPDRIEFLVNPKKKYFAIRKSSGGKNSHKIRSRDQHPHSYEIYSKSFVTELRQLDDSFDSSSSYTIVGRPGAGNDAVWFSLGDAAMNGTGKEVRRNG